jgi:hypothetical protein
MITMPRASRWRCFQTSARASSKAPEEIEGFFLSDGALAARAETRA